MYVVKQNQSNSGFTFDTQLQTALKYFVLITAEFYDKLNCEVPIRLDITPGGLFKSTTNKTTTAFCMVSQKKVSALCAHTWFMMLRTHPVGVLSVYRSIFCRNLSVELALAFFKISKDHPKACQFKAAIERVEQLVQTTKTEPTTEKTEVEVLEEGEIPQDSGTGKYPYSSLAELLDNVEISFPCPIHQNMIDELKSKKEDCDDVFLRCSTARCPVFCNLNDYNHYYYECQRQGHPLIHPGQNWQDRVRMWNDSHTVFDSIRNKLWQNVFAMQSTPL